LRRAERFGAVACYMDRWVRGILVIRHMSISIYYTARRERPLSSDEQAAVDRIRASYSIRDQVERYVQTRQGHNGENFYVYDHDSPTEPGVIFEGATKLPDNSEGALWKLLQRWCKLLSEVRRTVAGAEWYVHLDDHEIAWDEAAQEYDPTA
jgi:hypothetical protein